LFNLNYILRFALILKYKKKYNQKDNHELLGRWMRLRSFSFIKETDRVSEGQQAFTLRILEWQRKELEKWTLPIPSSLKRTT
jgi:hypothetical protein